MCEMYESFTVGYRRPSAFINATVEKTGLTFTSHRLEMSAVYRLSVWRRAANVLVRGLLRLGLAPPHTYLLSVEGRKTGKPYSTPVTLVEEGRDRWIVAPYGEVNWVRNARAAGKVTLSRGRKSETVAITELKPRHAAPVLKKYVNRVPITRPFFDASPDADLDAFVAEAARHPVFHVRAL